MLWLAPPATAGAPLAHTYSIVARDPETGQIGVAVQSHWFQVGPLVPWARAGVGAVATQSFVKIDYGPQGLELLEQGLSAQEALDRMLAEDPQKDVRQVAIVDAEGRVASWTGPNCIAEAGHQQGKGYSVQANLMLSDSVWPSMAKAFETAEGDLADRLMAALHAAEAEGGDIRGRQSAAILVVAPQRDEKIWDSRLIDLRVDDHPAPLEELDRLLGLHRAYAEMNLGDEAMAAGEVEAAVEHYSKAARMYPDNPELPFWQAVTLFSSDRKGQAMPLFRDVFEAEERWIEVVRRLPAAGLLAPGAPDEILAAAGIEAAPD
jgi:uncharacterized Ntn-hydrolase superfamily protein